MVDRAEKRGEDVACSRRIVEGRDREVGCCSGMRPRQRWKERLHDDDDAVWDLASGEMENGRFKELGLVVWFASKM